MLLPRLARLAPALRLRRSPTAAFFSSTASAKMKVVPVPVRDDNYAYLLIDDSTNKAAAVDPYDVPKVQAAAEKAGVQIVAGITTHHHFDHSGGNQVSPCYTHNPPLCGWVLTRGSRPQAFVRNTLCDVADRACSNYGLCSRLHTRTCRYMAGAPRSLHLRTRSRTRMNSMSRTFMSGMLCLQCRVTAADAACCRCPVPYLIPIVSRPTHKNRLHCDGSSHIVGSHGHRAIVASLKHSTVLYLI